MFDDNRIVLVTSTTARSMTQVAESRGKTAACEKTGNSQREPLFCGDSWIFFFLQAPFTAMVPDSGIDKSQERAPRLWIARSL